MNDDHIALLRQIAKDVADIKAAMAAGVAASAATLGVTAAPGGSAGGIANDRDLDSEHGDPLVRKDPPRWHGVSFVGCRYSETSPEYLDELASFKDWTASKNDGDAAKKKYAGYDRRDAARARGWAARLRAGWRPAHAMNGAGGRPLTDDDYDSGEDPQW